MKRNGPKKYFLCLPTYTNITLSFFDNVSFGERESLLLQAYVPGIRIVKKMPKSNLNDKKISIDYFKSDNIKIDSKKETIRIYDNWSKEIPVYFFHLIYSISHYALLKKGYYTVHSACVGTGNQWSLLLGHTGVGKTTVMLNLLRNYKFKMFSSNKTLIKFQKDFCLEAIAGTTTITCKDNISNKLKKITKKKVNFVNRIAYKLPNEYSTLKNKVKISRLYFVKLNPAVEECVRLSNFESMVALYPLLFDYINSDIILFNGEDLYNGTSITTREKKKMLSSLKKSLISLAVYNLNGSLDFISKTIEEHYEK